MGKVAKQQKLRREKLNWALVYLGLFVSSAAWGYSVNSPYWASLLFLISLGFLLAAFWKYFEFKRRIKVVVTVLFLVVFLIVDSKWVAYVIAPSFLYVKPAVLLNPQQPNAFWVFIVVVRGRDALYNASVHFQDLDRPEAVRKELNEKMPLNETERLLQSDFAGFNYAELDPNTTGGNDNEAAQFYWTPGILDDEHYDIVLVHRKGTIREKLNVKRIGAEWQYAMRVTDMGSHKILIECRDPKFPNDSEWKRELSRCFPDYQAPN